MKSLHPHQHLFALELLSRAEEFFQSYKSLPSGAPPSWPRYFLFCHAMELALKAYLAWKGYDLDWLKKKFGHGLSGLLSKATEEGLELAPTDRAEIELLDEAHARLWPRYPKFDGKPVFVVDQVGPHGSRLLCAVSAALRSLPTPNWDIPRSKTG